LIDTLEAHITPESARHGVPATADGLQDFQPVKVLTPQSFEANQHKSGK